MSCRKSRPLVWIIPAKATLIIATKTPTNSMLMLPCNPLCPFSHASKKDPT